MLMMFIWMIMPVLSIILAAIYLYRKVRGAVTCFFPDRPEKRQRILAGVLAAVLIIPAFRLYGISLDDAGLQKVVERINAENADIVVLDGDLVDESTTLEQMQSAFRILGQAKSNYGIYYVYGNHDKNNYASTPNYTAETLAETIRDSGIQILEDEIAVVNQEIALIGRGDRSDPENARMDIESLVENLDQTQEWIVLDHQPAEYENVEAAGADLILSGHTHAGQIWPAGLFATLFHFDDLNYGEKKINNLNAVVTSGIAGWGYTMRTEKHSEYVVLNIMPE